MSRKQRQCRGGSALKCDCTIHSAQRKTQRIKKRSEEMCNTVSDRRLPGPESCSDFLRATAALDHAETAGKLQAPARTGIWPCLCTGCFASISCFYSLSCALRSSLGSFSFPGSLLSREDWTRNASGLVASHSLLPDLRSPTHLP